MEGSGRNRRCGTDAQGVSARTLLFLGAPGHIQHRTAHRLEMRIYPSSKSLEQLHLSSDRLRKTSVVRRSSCCYSLSPPAPRSFCSQPCCVALVAGTGFSAPALFNRELGGSHPDQSWPRTSLLVLRMCFRSTSRYSKPSFLSAFRNSLMLLTPLDLASSNARSNTVVGLIHGAEHMGVLEASPWSSRPGIHCPKSRA